MPQAIDNNTLMITGGWSDYTRNETHIFSTKTQQWSKGPTLNQGRRLHGCGRVKIGNKKIALVTGGWNGWYGGKLSSVELIDLDDINGKWTNGWNSNFHLV